MSPDLWTRVLLALFPRDFRERQGEDLLATLEDWIAHSAPADRPRVRRRARWQLFRAGLAERLAKPDPPSTPSPLSRSSWMEDLRQDLTHAFRTLTRRPAFSVMVIVTLAIGLGAGAAMFGVVNGILLQPLPFDEPERLVTVMRTFTNQPGREDGSMALPDLRDLQESSRSLEAVAGWGRARGTMIHDGEARLLVTGRVTDGLLAVFGLSPHVGRDLSAEDAAVNAPRTVVLSYGMWRSHFAGRADVIGESLMLSGAPHTIVGVAPQGFEYPAEAEVWVPWQIDPEDCGRDCHMVDTVARLAPGMDAQRAGRELEIFGEALADEYPASNTHKRFFVRQLQEQEVAPVQSALWMLMGAVLLVVLIAAANVANLVLVRGARRRRELAIRTAIGAGRARLFRQLMLENALLALAGAGAGLVVGLGLLRAFLVLAPEDLPRLDSVALDGQVVAFTMALSMVVLVLFGWLPSLRISGVELRDRGGAGSRQSKRSRRLLLTAEVALTLVLLLGAGLLLRSFVHITEVELGFSPDRVTRFNLVQPDAVYPEAEDSVRLSEQLETRLANMPGVEAAGFAFSGPQGGVRIGSSLKPLDRPAPEPGEELKATYDVVSAGFFDTLQIPIVQGRGFTRADTRDAPLALVISQSLAERYYPDKDPVGERAEVGVDFGFGDEGKAFTIVGVAADIRAYSLTDDPAPAVYMAQAQTGSPYLTGFVRTQAGVDVMPAVRNEIAAVGPMLAIHSVSSQEVAVREASRTQRFYMALLGCFAAIALLLSTVGIYGVVAFLVGQRTRELAVRMALGADTFRVLRLVLLDALKPAFVGTAIGLLGALLAAGVLEKLLYGVTAHDTLTYLVAPSLVIALAGLACLLPAIRAARLEPRTALEEE